MELAVRYRHQLHQYPELHLDRMVQRPGHSVLLAQQVPLELLAQQVLQVQPQEVANLASYLVHLAFLEELAWLEGVPVGQLSLMVH
jgi:hypothetical protein